MKFGSRLILAAGLTAFAAACGAGGGGTPAPAVSPTGEPFEEGIPPSDNEFTQRAALALIQAQQLEESEPDEARARYQAALEAAEAGIEHDPENAESHFQGGRASLGLGDFEGADRHFTRAEELYPAFFVEIEPIREAYWVDAYNEAIELINAGNLESAANLFEQADVIYDRRPEANLNLGSVYTQMGDLDGAIAAYERALEAIENADPDLIEQEMIDEWQTEHRDVALLNLAQLLTHTERHAEAVEVYNTYLEQNPGDINATSNLAVALLGTGDSEGAARIYEELMARDDLRAQDFSAIGVGLFQISAYDQAAEAFERAVELNPNSRDDVYNWAQTLFLAEEWEEFVPAASRLVEVDPYNSDAYRLYAHGLVQTGDEQEAVRQMERMEGLPFEIINTSLQLFADEGAQLVGEVHNLQLSAGTPIQIEITFIGPDGADADTTQVQLQAPPEGEMTEFQAEIAQGQVIGYRYEVLSP